MEEILFLTVIVVHVPYLWLRLKDKEYGLSLSDPYLLSLFLFAFGSFVIFHTEELLYSHNVLIISSLASISGALGAIFSRIAFSRQYSLVDYRRLRLGSSIGSVEEKIIYIGTYICLLIVLIYSYYLLFHSNLSGMMFDFLNNTTSLSSIRKSITSGSQEYLFPGYIKQFRDILLPVFLVSIILLNRKSFFLKAALAINIFAILLTGQRGLFVITILIFSIGYYYRRKIYSDKENFHVVSKNLIFISLASFLVYTSMSVFLGRVDIDESTAHVVSESILNIVDRVVLTVPRENMNSYHIWGSMAPTIGESWLQDLSGILPGIEKNSLSNLLHHELGGSMQGNAVLGMSSDIFLAWGIVGILTVPFVYSLFISFVDLLLASERSVVFFALKIYLSIALLIIYSPFMFVLYGGGTALLLTFALVFLKYLRKPVHNNF